jgi:hypothetical protein
VPLRAVYFLTAGDAPAVEPIRRPDPRLLLGNTFVVGVQTPERLRRQLDVCSTIVRSVPLFELRRGPGVASERLAQVVDEHAGSLRGAPREDAA